MNKLLRYSFVALMAMIGMNVMADDVVIDFNKMDLATSSGESTAGDITEAKTFEQEGVTVTISPKAADASNENRFWSTNNGPQLRCYSGSITIKANSTMKTIAFDAPSKFNMTADKGAINSQTWTGEANEVVFAVGGNTQINKITISAEASEVPTIEEITVAKAIELCNALGDGATSESEYQVKGFVVGKPDFQRKADETLYGNVNFTMADEKGGTNLLTVYRGKDLDNANFTEETINRFKEGDEVVFQGKLQKYVKSGAVTPELTNGYLISVVAGGSGSQEEGLSVGIIRPTFTAGDGTVTYDTWNYIESVDKFNKSADGLTVKFFQSAEIEATIVKDEAQEGGYEIKQVCRQGEKNISVDYVWKLNCTAGGANKHDDANAIGSENWNFGFDLTVADGKAFNVSAIDFDLLVEQNPAYRIRIMKGETEVYNSTWITKTGGYNNKEWGAGSYCRITKDDVSFLFEEKNAEGNAINYQAIQYYPGFEEKFGVMTPLGDLILAAGTYRVIADVDYNKDSAKAMSFDNFTLEGELVDASGISVAKSNVKANNGVIYNLAGQKVGKDYKGIVIMNGKKMIQK